MNSQFNRAGADVTATWNGNSGNWTDPTQWSTNPNYPNNGIPAGTDYVADITQPGSGAYAVTVSSNIAVDELTVGSSNATLNEAAGTLTVGGMNITAGVFELNGGTLSGGSGGATVTLSSPSQFQLIDGTLDNLTFAGSNLSFNQIIRYNSLHITNGLNLSGNALNITASSQPIVFDGLSQTIDDLGIDVTASTQLVFQIGGPLSTGPVTLMLGPNATVHGSLSINDIPNYMTNSDYSGDTLVNNGVLDADISAKTLAVNPSNFTNNGTAEATNGGTLSILSPNWTNAIGGTISADGSTLTFIGSWSNAGTITAIGASTLTFGGAWSNAGNITTSGASTVNLGGTFAATDLSGYSPSASTITNITGTMNNAGNTLTLNSVSGTWNLKGGTISGGTVAFSNDLNVLNGTLNGVTIASGSFVNVNSGDTLNLSGSWNNAGTINANGTATVNLGGAFTIAALGTYNASTATVTNITGTLNNAGNTLTFNGLNGSWKLNGGTITGGTISLAGSPVLGVSSGTFNGVQLAGGDLNLIGNSAGLTILGGLTGDGHNINLTGQSEYMVFAGSSQTIDNVGIDATTSSQSGLFLGGTSSVSMTLTLGANANIHGNLNFVNGNSGSSALVNNGTINADISSQTLAINTGSFANNLSAQATNGGTLSIAATTWSNTSSGTISATASTLSLGGTWSNAGTISTTGASTVNLGGSFTAAALVGYNPSSGTTTNITGIFDNIGNTLTLSGLEGTWNLAGGTITGGTYAIGNMPELNIQSGTLNGVAVTSGTTVNISAGGSLTMAGAWNNQGSITGTTTSTLNLGGTFSLTSLSNLAVPGSVNLTGTLNLAGGTLAMSSQSGTWTLNGGSIIDGTIALSSTQNLIFANGTLDGDTVTGGDLVVSQTNGNIYLKDGTTVSDGNIDLTASGSSIYFDGGSQMLNGMTINAGLTYPPAAGKIYVGGPSSTSPVTLTLGPTTTLHGAWTVNNNPTTNSGTLVNYGAITTDPYGGTDLTINTSNFSNYGVMTAANGAPLGILSANWTNYGSIQVNGSGLTLGGNWVNNGNITVQNSSELYLDGSYTTAGVGIISLVGQNQVLLGGVFNNQGGVFPINGSNTWELDGTIQGGTLSFAPGQSMSVYAGKLQNVNLNGGTLVLTSGEQHGLTVEQGMTGTNAVIDLGSRDELVFGGASQTINGVTIFGDNQEIGDPPQIYIGGADSTGPLTVTLGPTALMHGSAYVYNGAAGGPVTLVNEGTINADSAGQYLDFQTNGFGNQGILEATNGGTLVIVTSSNWINTGTLSTTAGSTLIVDGSVTSGTQGSLVNNGTTVFDSTATIHAITGTGNLTVGYALQILPNSGQCSQASITMNGAGAGATLDITNNSIIITPTTSLATALAYYQGLVNNGYAGGTWTGTTSITSSTVAASVGGALTYGIAVADGGDGSGNTMLSPNQLEITAALDGDCTLSGTVDSTDLGIVLADWEKTGMDWDEGDFNGDGTVDSTDLGLLLANWQDTASLSVSDLDAIESLTDDSIVANADGVGFQLISVPEPASISLLAVGSIFLLRRRRRVVPSPRPA